MLPINPDQYRMLAKELTRQAQGLNFYNGSVQVPSEDGYARLTCTLILQRNPMGAGLLGVLPVWWEYHAYGAGGEIITEFDWAELDRYIPKEA